VPLCFIGLLHSLGFFSAAQLEAAPPREGTVPLGRPRSRLDDANILFAST
jgi:hypothetical protein